MAGYAGYGPNQSQIANAMAAGSYFAPDNSPNPLGSGSNVFSGTSDKWKKALSLATDRLLQSSSDGRNEDKYRDEVERVKFGSSIAASIGEGPDESTKIYTSAQPAPVYLAGVQGSPGFGGALGSIAGAALGSFIPGVGPALGAQLGGTIGGAFG